jgi:hypothetical protein
MEMSNQLHDLVRFTRGNKALGTHWTGGWMGSRASLDAVEKSKTSCPHPAIETRFRSGPVRVIFLDVTPVG